LRQEPAAQTNVDLAQVVSGAGDTIMVCGAAGAITLWNAAAERIFGFPEADVLRVPALHKDGHTLSIAFADSMLFFEDHKVTGIAAIVRDETARFTEKRKLRARLLEAQARTHGEK
jgi:PAS domain-containing protein